MKNKNLLNLKNLKNKNYDGGLFLDSSRSDEIYFNKQIFVESLTDRNICKKCENYKEILQKINTQYEKEKKNYTYLLNFKDIALKKRDEMLYAYNQENLELRTKIKKLEFYLYKSNGKIVNYDKVNELDQSPKRLMCKEPNKLTNMNFTQQSFSHNSTKSKEIRSNI